MLISDLDLRQRITSENMTNILKNDCFVFYFYKKGLPEGLFKNHFLWFNKSSKFMYNFSGTYHMYKNVTLSKHKARIPLEEAWNKLSSHHLSYLFSYMTSSL